MSLYDKISEARGAGYSDDEILEGLRKKYPVMGARIDTAIGEQYKPTEIIDYLSKKDEPTEAKAETGTPAGASYDAFTGTSTPETNENADPLAAGKALLAGVKRLPQELAATVIQTAKGQSGATVTDKGPLDRFLEQNERDKEAFVKEYGSDKQILPGMPISVKDVAELPSNLAFSGTSAVAGLAAGGATLAATKSPFAAYAAGGAASGAMAYRATSNQIMQQYLEAMNETAQEQFGRDITPEEEAKLKSKFSNLATAYGLWEAVPEAIGNVTELNIILKPLSKMVGENVAKKIISKVWKTYGTELGTETVTQIGQQQVESQIGLTPETPRSFTSPTDWATSAKEVAPQVFLLTTLMGGTVGGTAAVYRKFKSKKLSDTVQDLTGRVEEMQDEEVDTLLENAKEIKKKRTFDKKLDDSIAKLETEAEKRKAAAPAEEPVVEGEAEEVTPYPALPQDAYDQMRKYLVEGKDNKGNPFTMDHVKVFRERYTSDPNANPESIRMLDQFIEDAESGDVLKPTEDTTQLMHSLRSDLMQGLPIEQGIEKANEIKGRHPKLADDINKLIIEFQGKKIPGVAPVAPVFTELTPEKEAEARKNELEAQNAGIPTVPLSVPPAAEIVPPGGAGEAVAPETKPAPEWVNENQGEEKYGVRDQHRRGALKPAKLSDVKKFFPGQEVGLDANKNIYVKTRGGKYVTLYKVDRIDADNAVLQAGYGKPNLAPGAIIPGAMGVTNTGEFYIKLHRTFGDTWTLAHESMHFLETAGIINSLDVAALRGHIKRLHREGKWETANRKDIGGPEDRANFIADRLAVKEQRGPIGRIILRIRAFIDGILETFGVRSPEGILRGIESGRIFERTGREGKETAYSVQQGPFRDDMWKIEDEEWKQYRNSLAPEQVGAAIKQRELQTEANVLEAIKANPDIGHPELAQKIGIALGRLGGATQRLKNKGLIKITEAKMGPGENEPSKYRATQTEYFSVRTPDLPDFMQQYLDQKEEAVQKEYGAFAFDEKSTKNQGWWQLHPSDQFKDFFTTNEWHGIPETAGISYVIGKREGYIEPQAIHFDRSKFDEKAAEKWWDRHKKLFSTENLWRPKAMEMPSLDASPKKLNDWMSNETELNVQAIVKREGELAKQGVKRLLPSNLPHNTWLENMLKSPEWMSHPVLSRIVKLMMSTRSELFHENFNHMTDNKVIEETKTLKGKGLSWPERLAGKTSKEYELFGRLMDYGDTLYKRNKKEPLSEQKAKFEKWMRMQIQSAGMNKETENQIIKVWKFHRDTYDKGLDLMTAQMRSMINELKLRESEEIPLLKIEGKPDLSSMRQTLEYHLAKMDEWKGFYAPRVRNRGSWWVWAHRGTGDAKEYVMDFRGSGMAADRLARHLKDQGWTVSRNEEVKKLPEDIYQQLKTVAVAKTIEKAMSDMKRGLKGEAHNDLIMKFNEELLENVSDELKARGFRSSMIHRATDKIVKGYKEDPLERLIIYTNNTSAGLAKATTAKMAVNELFGEQDEEGNHVGGIDPVKEPRAYQTAQSYIEEQLRNVDQSDRIIGLAKSIATFKYLGFNIRSAFVNTTALATTAPPAIQQYALDGKVGFTRIMNELARASKDFGMVMVGKTLENADEQAFMDEMKKKGYDDPQYAQDALGSIMKIQHRAWGLMMDASMYIFGKTEQWNRGTTMLAAYRLARKQGFSRDESVERAKTASDKAHGVYGKATLPAWAMGKNPAAKIGQMMYVYGKFSHNYMQMLYDLGVKKHNIKAFTFAMLAPLVVGGLAAFPFREQLFAIAGFLLKALFGSDVDPEKWVWDQIRKNFGDTAELVGRHGVTGAMGLDISSSLSIGVGVPKGFADLAGPAGGVVEDVMQAGHYAKQGRIGRALEKVAPRAAENVIKAFRESEEGVVTKAGHRVWDEKGKPFVPTTGEAVERALGFRSARQAVISERTWEAKRQIADFSDRKKAIYERYRAYLASGRQDPAEHLAITRAVREFNQGLKDADASKEVPKITFEAMRRQRKEMAKPSKRERAMLRE